MMGEFKQELRDGFIEACLHLVNRDFDALAKDFVTLGYHDYLSFYRRLFSLILVFLKTGLLSNSTGFFRQLQTRKLLQRL